MQCGFCEEAINAETPVSNLECGCRIHTKCFLDKTLRAGYQFEQLHCPSCNTYIIRHQDYDDIQGNHINPHDMMGELEQTNPDFRESCKKIRKGLAAYRKLKKEVYKHIMQEKAAFNQDINFHVNYIQQKKDEAVERVMQSENYKNMQSAKRKYKLLMTKLTKTHSLQKWDADRYFREYRCWRWNNNPAKSYLRVYI